jgi:Tat protein secretion system quality control protein TatD with DNase activity
VADASVSVHPHDAANVDGAAWACCRDGGRSASSRSRGGWTRRIFSPVEARANLAGFALALATSKPAILHCRSAGATAPRMRSSRASTAGSTTDPRLFSGRPGVIHSFSGPIDYADTLLATLAIRSVASCSAAAEASADVARIVPPDRLLVETDSPFLSPPGAPRRRNEPEWVSITVRWLADQRGEEPEPLGDRLVASFDGILPRIRPR